MRIEPLKIGSLLSSVQQDLGDESAARSVMERLSRFAPSLDANLSQMSSDQLEAYFWYLEKKEFLEPYTEQNEWRLQSRRRLTEIGDRLVALGNERAEAHSTRGMAYSNLGNTFTKLQKKEDAAKSKAVALDEAKLAFQRAPQNSQYRTDYAWELKDLSSRLATQGDFKQADEVGRQAWEIMKPALDISPDSAVLVDVASRVLDNLGWIASSQRQFDEALGYNLDAVELSVKLLETDPRNRSVADDAAWRFGNLSTTLSGVGDHTQQRKRCLSLSERVIAIRGDDQRNTPLLNLVGATVNCALEAEKALKKEKSTASGDVDAFLRGNENYFIRAFRDTKLEGDDIGEFYDRFGTIIQRLQEIAVAKGDAVAAESYAKLIISTIARVAKHIDYDLYTLQKLSKAHLELGDYRRQARDNVSAADHYRICADPDQVSYPRSDCMERLVEMIDAGALGAGHEDEAKTLRARIPHYKSLKRFTVPAKMESGQTFPFNVFVSTSPKGYEGIDDQVLWAKKNRGLEVPKDVVESFRKLDKIARENKVVFGDLAAYAIGTELAPVVWTGPR